MNIIEAIKERRSVRSFNGKGLTSTEIDQLRNTIEDTCSPFGGDVKISLNSYDLSGEFIPGTYGVIKGAKNFFTVICTESEDSYLSVGFRFEQVVLKAWQMGLGTCWIAATFKGSDFEKGVTFEPGELMRIVSPVGVPASKRVLEKITRFVAGSDKRKPFDSMFFEGNFSTPLNKDNSFAEPLEMLRLSPSSTNSQPWRALVDGDTVHFYYVRKSSLSVLDCGIGLCHFFETEKYNLHSGEFLKAERYPESPHGWIYLRSYKRK